MKYTQMIVIVFGLVAAILGIYATKTPPYTNIAAGAVAAASVLGVAQAFHAADEARFVKQVLSHLVRSNQPSAWWMTHVNKLIESTASSHGHKLVSVLNEPSSTKDGLPVIMVFRLASAEPPRRWRREPEWIRSGLLVISPDDYRELSMRSERKLKREVEALVGGSWSAPSAAEVDRRIADTAIALYAIATKEGFDVLIRPHCDPSIPLRLELGDVKMTFTPAQVDEMLAMPPIERDLRIAETLEALEPKLGKHIKV